MNMTRVCAGRGSKSPNGEDQKPSASPGLEHAGVITVAVCEGEFSKEDQ